MLTTKREELTPAHASSCLNIEQMYGRETVEHRLQMQRVRGYAEVLLTHIQRNRLFVQSTGGNFFENAKKILVFVDINCEPQALWDLIYPEVSEEALELLYQTMEGRGLSFEDSGEGIPILTRIYAVAKAYEEKIWSEELESMDALESMLEDESLQPELVEIAINNEHLLQKLNTEYGVR